MLPGKGEAGRARWRHRLGGQQSRDVLLGERDSLRCPPDADRDDDALRVGLNNIAKDLVERIVIDDDRGEDRGCQGESVEAGAKTDRAELAFGAGSTERAEQRPGSIVDGNAAAAVVFWGAEQLLAELSHHVAP